MIGAGRVLFGVEGAREEFVLRVFAGGLARALAVAMVGDPVVGVEIEGLEEEKVAEVAKKARDPAVEAEAVAEIVVVVVDDDAVVCDVEEAVVPTVDDGDVVVVDGVDVVEKEGHAVGVVDGHLVLLLPWKATLRKRK